MASIGQLGIKQTVPGIVTFPNPDDADHPYTIKVQYYRGRIKPRLMRQMAAEGQPAEQVDGIVGLVLLWVASWDLTEDDGVTPVPLTRERLEDFDGDILNAIVIQLGQEQQSPNGSAATSSPAGSRGSLV